MARTPGVKITNVESTVDPTATDDISEALDIGSRWINTTNNSVWFCVDDTASAAVWKDVSASASGSHPVTISIVNPAVTDDSNSGFAIGDHWINTASLPKRAWQATDVSVGAAVWTRVTNVKSNIALIDPTISNDETENYEPGSQWYNAATSELFINLSAGTGVALWRVTSPSDVLTLVGATIPGSLFDYPAVGNSTTNLIQYIAVRLFDGKDYDRMFCFIDSGGIAARTVQLGVYDQVDPSTVTDPDTRIARTDVEPTNVTQPDYAEFPLTDGAGTPVTLSITETGIYWLALTTNSNSIKFAMSIQFRANYLPVRREVGSGGLLPASAGILTNPSSAVTLVGLLEVGATIPV